MLARYVRSSDTEKAMDYAMQSLVLAKQLDFVSGKTYAYNTVGIILQDKGEYKQALLYLDSSLHIARSANDTYAIAMSTNNIGLVHLEQGNYENALRNLQDAAKLREQIGDKRGEAGSYNNLGLVYSYMGQDDKAIGNYRRSLQLKEELGDRQGVANTYLNIGLSYSGLKDTAQERENYRRALEIYISIDDKKGQSMVYNNFGEVFLEEGDSARALVYLEKAYALRKERGDIVGQAQTGTNIALCLMYSGRPDEAETYLRRSIELARTAGSKKESVLAYAGLSQLYVLRGDYRSALDAFRISAAVKDSMFNEESTMHLQEMQAKYETEKSEREILELQAEAERADYERNITIIIVSAILLIAGVAGWFRFQRYRAEQEKKRELAVLETKQNERMRIARDMHDDIGSGLSRISLLSEQVKLSLNSSTGEVGGTLERLTKLATESRQLTGNIGEIIWTMSPKNDTLDGLIAYLRNYASDYLDHADIDCRFSTPDEIPSVPVLAETRRNIFLVVKEALHNIVKHARCSAVNIDVQIAPSSFTISVSDNGTGMEEKRTTGGNGLNNMKKRIADCGGICRMETVPGSGVRVILEGIPLGSTTKV